MAEAREFTIEELAQYDGSGADGKIYISVRGTVYDVTAGRDFYGPGAGYHVFAGKDATRCLAKMQISDTEANCGWENLSEENLETLQEWEDKYKAKYPVVGTLQRDQQFVARGAVLPP